MKVKTQRHIQCQFRDQIQYQLGIGFWYHLFSNQIGYQFKDQLEVHLWDSLEDHLSQKNRPNED